MVNTAEVPKYRMLDAFFDETNTLREMGTIIEYEGTPNLSMQPLNEAALQCLTAYEAKLHEGAKLKAMSEGRPYTGKLPTLDDAMNEAMVSRPRELNTDAPIIKATPQTESLAVQRARGKNKLKSATPPLSPPMQPLQGRVVNHDA